MVPDLFIVGATKCATSSIHYQLGQSGWIGTSMPKEPRFLERGLSIETAKEGYNKCFGGDAFLVEANPNHFVIGYAPEKIKLINPDAKILIVIREPVSRTISHINYFRNMRPGREATKISMLADFDLDKFDCEADYVPYICEEWGNYKPMYIETSCYIHYIPRFARLFDTRIVIFEDYIENPQGEIDQIMDWIDYPRFELKDTRIRNQGEHKWQPSESSMRGFKELFKPYNEKLFTRLGRELWTY